MLPAKKQATTSSAEERFGESQLQTPVSEVSWNKRYGDFLTFIVFCKMKGSDRLITLQIKGNVLIKKKLQLLGIGKLFAQVENQSFGFNSLVLRI